LLRINAVYAPTGGAHTESGAAGAIGDSVEQRYESDLVRSLSGDLEWRWLQVEPHSIHAAPPTSVTPVIC